MVIEHEENPIRKYVLSVLYKKMYVIFSDTLKYLRERFLVIQIVLHIPYSDSIIKQQKYKIH